MASRSLGGWLVDRTRCVRTASWSAQATIGRCSAAVINGPAAPIGNSIDARLGLRFSSDVGRDGRWIRNSSADVDSSARLREQRGAGVYCQPDRVPTSMR